MSDLIYTVQRYRHATNDYEILVTKNGSYHQCFICEPNGTITEMDLWNETFEEFESVPLRRKTSDWYVERLGKIKQKLLDAIDEHNESEKTG